MSDVIEKRESASVYRTHAMQRVSITKHLLKNSGRVCIPLASCHSRKKNPSPKCPNQNFSDMFFETNMLIVLLLLFFEKVEI